MRAFSLLLLYAIGVFGVVGGNPGAGAAGPARGPLVAKATFVRLAGAKAPEVLIGRKIQLVRGASAEPARAFAIESVAADGPRQRLA